MIRSSLLCTVLLWSAVALSAVAKDTEEAPVAYLVGGAHLDSQWNWDVTSTINEYIPNTVRQNLFLLNRYPSYIFNFEGGIKYAWMKEYYPDMYERVKEQVAAGRWHVAGASWEANEVLVSSSESLIRNILIGQTFYRREFGVSSTDIYLPDCFGFGFNLPTIAAHCGLIGFSTQKLQWRSSALTDQGQYPFTFGIWEGIDGSRIAAAANAFDYSRAWNPGEDLSESQELYDKAISSSARAVYHYYGTGDIGGSPTIASVEAVDKAAGKQGLVKIVSAESDCMYRDFMPLSEYSHLPVYRGEMPMDIHGNACYTSQAAMKLYNRENELLGGAAERCAVIADWLQPGSYPADDLSASWKRFIWHQFHDDLTGTSIPRAYEYSWNDELLSLKRFASVLTASMTTLCREMDTHVKGIPVVIYNPSSHPVCDVTEITLPCRWNGNCCSVYDENEKLVESQLLKSTDDSVTLLIRAALPAMGVVVYDVRPGRQRVSSQELIASSRTLENEIYRLVLNDEGNIVSWYDKRYDREWIAKGEAIAPQLFTNNDSFQWPAWEIKRDVIDSQPTGIFDECNISLVERGPLRATLCVDRGSGSTRWLQYISLVAGSDRIDIKNEMEWHSTRTLLKMAFPLSVVNDSARYDIGVGTISRPSNNSRAYETYAHRWAGIVDRVENYGVSILSDSKYGWDKPDEHTLRLTLMHTPAAESAFLYQNQQDWGYHTFGYALIAHLGDEAEGDIPSKAEMYDCGLKSFTTSKHKGRLGRSFSWLTVDAANLEVMALKKAEDGYGYILRLCEKHGKNVCGATIALPMSLQSVFSCDGTELILDSLPFAGQTFVADVPAYGVRTYRIIPAPYSSPLGLSASSFVDLPYNQRCVSYNEFRNTADFDGKGCSFAAELFPDTLYCDGVAFVMGDKNRENGVKCLGDTIYLPQDAAYNRLYILAASTLDDYKAQFYIDGEPYELHVPYYSGFIGQWGHDGHTCGFLKAPDVAYVGTHKHDMNGNCDKAYEYTYMFKLGLNLQKGARMLVLPHNSRIVLFAATVVCEDSPLQAVSPLYRTAIRGENVDYKDFSTYNLLSGKEITDFSGKTSDRESPCFAIDGSEHTKWADYHKGIPNYIEVDLGSVTDIKGWRVMHAGNETPAFITREYELQIRCSQEEAWSTVDAVKGNTKNVTDRNLPSVAKARYVRLFITAPVRDGGDIARICEWEVY